MQSLIRTLLNTDRLWSAYALGDLAPHFAPYAEWRVNATRTALILLFRKFAVPVLFALGAPSNAAPLLAGITDERLCLLILPEILPLLQPRFTVARPLPMRRMALDPAHFAPARSAARRLTPADLPALQTLYADGLATNEAPDFFTPDMVTNGVFYGVWEGGALSAAAGTHLFVPQEGVAAIGNVYTRHDRRGRGLAKIVTSAVAAECLRHAAITTLVLNVSADNLPAQRVYQSLGFRFYMEFYEGTAVRANNTV
jgi:ribosomal protein S18 acetylase RimI-like enzyme